MNNDLGIIRKAAERYKISIGKFDFSKIKSYFHNLKCSVLKEIENKFIVQNEILQEESENNGVYMNKPIRFPKEAAEELRDCLHSK